MPEGVAAGGHVLSGGMHDDRDSPPEPGPEAPRGWTWDRINKRHKPRIRGPVLWKPDRQPDPDRAGGHGAGPDAEEEPASDVQSLQDPEPGWARPAEPGRPAAIFEVTPETRSDIKALIALAYVPLGEGLPLADPYCFAPLAERKTAEGIIGAVTDIVCGSPRVAQWAASAAGLMPWIKLAYALKPVAINVLHHHITKSVEVEIDRETRKITVADRDWSMFPAA